MVMGTRYEELQLLRVGCEIESNEPCPLPWNRFPDFKGASTENSLIHASLNLHYLRPCIYY